MYKSSVSVFAIIAMLSVVGGASEAHAFFGDSDVYAEDVKPVSQEPVKKESAKKADEKFEELKVEAPTALAPSKDEPEDLTATTEEDEDSLPTFPRRTLSVGDALGDGTETMSDKTTDTIKKIQAIANQQPTGEIAVDDVPVATVPAVPPTTVGTIATDVVKETKKVEDVVTKTVTETPKAVVETTKEVVKQETIKTVAPAVTSVTTPALKPIAPPVENLAKAPVVAPVVAPVEAKIEKAAEPVKEAAKTIETKTTEAREVKTIEAIPPTTESNDYIGLSKVPARPALTSAERAAQIKAELQKDLQHAKQVQADVAEKGIDALDEESDSVSAFEDVKEVTTTTTTETVETKTPVVEPRKSLMATPSEKAVGQKPVVETPKTKEAAIPALPTEAETSTTKTTAIAERSTLMSPPEYRPLAETSKLKGAVTPVLPTEAETASTTKTTTATKTATTSDIRSKDIVVPVKQLEQNMNAPRWSKTATEEQATDLVKKLENEKTLIRQVGVNMDMPTAEAAPEIRPTTKETLSVKDIYSVTKTQDNRVIGSGLGTIKADEVSQPVLNSATLDLKPENLSLLPQSRTENTDRVRREIRSKDEVVQLSAQSKAYKSSAAMSDASALVQQNLNDKGDVVSSLPTLPTQIDDTGKIVEKSSEYQQLVVEGKQPLLEMPALESAKPDLAPKGYAAQSNALPTVATSRTPTAAYQTPSYQAPVSQPVVSQPALSQVPTNAYQAPVAQPVTPQPVVSKPVVAEAPAYQQAQVQQPAYNPPVANAMTMPSVPTGAYDNAVTNTMNGNRTNVGVNANTSLNNTRVSSAVVTPAVMQQPVARPAVVPQYVVQQPQVIYKPQYYVVEVPVDQYGNPVGTPQQQIQKAQEAQAIATPPTPTYENVEAYKRPVRRRATEAFVPMRPTDVEREMMERKIKTTAEQLAKINLDVREIEEPLADESARIPFNIKE